MAYHKHMRGFTACIALWSLFCVLSACTSPREGEAERLNDKAFAWQYRSLDSVRAYADSVLRMDGISTSARAEALNNLAFYHIGRMRYAVADSLLLRVNAVTDNHIELAVASIQQMRLCQRRAKNKSYYECRQQALGHLRRLSEENSYTERQRRRIAWAETELRLVTSVYQYYVGQTDDAKASLTSLDSLGVERGDTTQLLAYLYDIGAGGILTHGSREQIEHMEYDYLVRCYIMAAEQGYTYWQANALQAIAEHIVADGGEYFRANPPALRYVNIDNVPDSLLAGNVAERSLALFRSHGDVYQQAATWRTLAECYSSLGDYPGAIYSLREAERVDTALHEAPALMASICELFSLAFSALDRKPDSDLYRNRYLDLYEGARQDRTLEARAEQLSDSVRELRALIVAFISLCAALLAWLVWLVMRRRRRLSAGEGDATASLRRLRADDAAQRQRMDEECEALEEQCAVAEQQLGRQQEAYAEHRAKLHLVESLTPLIDRLLHETRRLAAASESEETRQSRREYISEILARLNSDNALLTRWIQLRQGELSLNIETFALQPLLDIVDGGKAAFARQGITLAVAGSEESVKADRTLTLFMINTLADNARKFTPRGGTVTVAATAASDGMVEISVADTGPGMSPTQVARLFDVKPVADESLSASGADGTPGTQSSHGFGLLNCKGIIEKYKKTNALFARCAITVESATGRGTRVAFRIPRGMAKTMAVIAVLAATVTTGAHAAARSQALRRSQAETLVDSLYRCNVEGRYTDALHMASLALATINTAYRAQATTAANDTLLLTDTLSVTPAEVRWIRSGVSAPYDALLTLRNEVAVAALALHRWPLYRYNNATYSLLFREHSADNTLPAYCQSMEKTGNASRVAIILLVALVLALFPLYYFAYYRHVIAFTVGALNTMRREARERERQRAELAARLRRLTFERDRLHVANNVMANSLSAIKHETMYYPSRIAQLVAAGETAESDATARYYRSLYTLLTAQARHNCRRQLPPGVLRALALRLMARLAGMRVADITPASVATPYATYTLTLPATSRRQMPESREATLRVLTQAIRDLGELHSLRRCGTALTDTTLTVTMPQEQQGGDLAAQHT